MGLRKSNRKFVDLRKAAKDIAESAKKNANVGGRFEKLAKSGKKLIGLLRSDVLRE